MINHISSGGFVFNKVLNDVFVLLIMDNEGFWTFPKGHWEEYEIPNDNYLVTAKREIMEETGVSVENSEYLGLLYTKDYSFTKDGVMNLKKLFIHGFLLDKKSEIKVQNSEIKDTKWFKAEEAVNFIEYDKQLLKKVLIKNLYV